MLGLSYRPIWRDWYQRGGAPDRRAVSGAARVVRSADERWPDPAPVPTGLRLDRNQWREAPRIGRGRRAMLRSAGRRSADAVAGIGAPG